VVVSLAIFGPSVLQGQTAFSELDSLPDF
jgi:hypothetical protein